MEQHAIVSDDFLAAILLTGGGLRISATQVAGWQNSDRANVIKHRLGCKPDLTE